jgi:membrane fusion protein, multidrug efflux system
MHDRMNKAATIETTRRPLPLARFVFIAVVMIAVVIVAAMIPRWHARHVLDADARELAVPTVNTVTPTLGKAITGISYPAEVRPVVEAPIYARASG